MIPKSPCRLISFLILVFILSCQSDPSPKEVPEQEEELLTDTLYGDLTEKEQYYQHFIFEVPQVFQEFPDSIANWILTHQPGALHFKNWHPDTVSNLKLRLDTLGVIQPFYFVNYFDYLDLPVYPYWDAALANRDSIWTRLFANDRIGILDFYGDFFRSDTFETWIESWHSSSGIQFVTHAFDDRHVRVDFQHFINTIRGSENAIKLNITHFDTVKLTDFRKMTEYEGLFLVETEKNRNALLAGGADLIYQRATENTFGVIPFEEWTVIEHARPYFDESTERILRAKYHLVKTEIKAGITEQKKAVQSNLLFASNTLLNNKSRLLPLKPGVKLYAEGNTAISKQLRTENKVSTYKKSIADDLDEILDTKGVKIIFVGDSLEDGILAEINQISSDREAIICFSEREQYEKLKETPNLVFTACDKSGDVDFSILLQQLTGQLAFKGDFIRSDSILTGEKTKKRRLARTSPEFCGMSSDMLRNIDYAVRSAMGGRAFPGCQVLVAKNGCIVYDKSFGYHSYDQVKQVTAESLYDLASLTKVVSTTLVGMKLYEMEAYELDDSLKDYLPDTLRDCLPYPSTIRNITFQELFIHKSGMPAGFPIIKYLQYTSDEVGRFDRFFCDMADDTLFITEVAENFFLEACHQDSMWLRLNQIWLDPAKPYRYSDVNMNTLYFMFKSMLHNNPEKYDYKLEEDEKKKRNLYVEFLYDKFYKPLGMERTRYKPLEFFDKGEIVPTENERYWRKQLLQGHVHDPNSALHGGVAGNAGIFSTTNDLAILAEMLLRNGAYNGKQYLKTETVQKFTSTQPNSHRGLGFNKPSLNTSAFGCADSAPPKTFGHTGFTGTCIWVDPVNELTFIFLSNRVHPTVNNRIYQYGVRGNSHQYAYDSFLF